MIVGYWVIQSSIKIQAVKRLIELPQPFGEKQMSNEMALMREIAKLQEQINALRTIEIGGVWQDWTPTVIGWSSISLMNCQYSRIGNFVAVMYQIFGVSDAATIYLDLPFTEDTTPNVGAFAYGLDNGTALSTPAYVVTDTVDRVRVYKTAAGASWTASGGKRIVTQFFYKAA